MPADDSQLPFGERLRRWRMRAGLSQEALAERASLSVQAIGALETGKRRRPYPQTIAALATALGLTDAERALLAAAREPEPAAPLPPPAFPGSRPRARRLPSLVGRDTEIAAIVAALRAGDDPLLTLTGPGGVGKTSLALAVSDAASEFFDNDTPFVPLASIADSSHIAAEVAAALGLAIAGQQSPDDLVQRALRSRRLLLTLDNLEHLPEAALWVSELLAACPGVTVLATSRAPLRVRGEREIPVAPLALPDLNHAPDPGEFLDAAAVRLFVQRAALPDVALTPANAAAVTAICHRVDGLPLAIELAASRVKVLTPTELLARLDRMLPLLSGGPRDQSQRLQSMAAAIAWSYDLLTPEEQTLFRNLSVFSGGFTLEAAEELSAISYQLSAPDGTGDGGRRTEDGSDSVTRHPSPVTPRTPSPPERSGSPFSPSVVLDLLTSLVDHNLLRRIDLGDVRPRFDMLATIQAYGLEQLETSGGEEAARAAHASYYLRLAKDAWPSFRQRTGQEPWLDRLEEERANFRAALTWLDASGDAASLLQLAGALAWFWYVRGPLAEGRAWLDRAIAASDDRADPALLARAEVGAGLLAHFQGDGDGAGTQLEASLARTRDLHDPWLRAFAQLLLGMIAEDRADYAQAETRFREALPQFQAASDPANAALAMTHLGVVAWGRGKLQEATSYWEEALAAQRVAGETWGHSISLGYLGLLAGERGYYADAAAFHREGLHLRWAGGMWEDVAASFSDLAVLAAATGRAEQAARLFGAAAAVREEIGRSFVLHYPEKEVFDRGEARARAALGDGAFAAAEEAGRALHRRQAIAEAMALTDEITAAHH